FVSARPAAKNICRNFTLISAMSRNRCSHGCIAFCRVVRRQQSAGYYRRSARLAQSGQCKESLRVPLGLASAERSGALKCGQANAGRDTWCGKFPGHLLNLLPGIFVGRILLVPCLPFRTLFGGGFTG